MSEATASIIIPAHNEAAVIDRSLTALGPAIACGRVRVIVACNGCTDDTAARARQHDGVIVVETDVPSKVAAMRAGDEVASGGPRLYLDADVSLTSRAALAVIDALEGPAPRAARPPVHYDTTGGSWVVRRWYHVRGRLPSIQRVLWGAGLYAMSASGRERFGAFPDVVSDDLFIDSLFAADEVDIVDTDPIVIRPPRTLRSLLLVLRRKYRTQTEVHDKVEGEALSEGQRGQLNDLRRILSTRRITLLDAAVYAGAVVLSRLRARGSRSSEWERDESSRRPVAAASPSRGRATPAHQSTSQNHENGNPMSRKDSQGNRILIIVQNLPVPLDRRVWLECQALTAQGYEVSVICPKGPGDPAHHVIDGVHLYKYAPAPDAAGLAGFAREFSYSWFRTALLSFRVRRQRGFDVIQACNPPDTYWLLALLWRLRGVRFVFDQHDLNPELFVSRFGEPVSIKSKLLHAGLLWLERMTYRSADHVISTNGSYRSIAITRGTRAPDSVTVVRSGPDTRVMRPVQSSEEVKEPGTFLLAYLGIMGPQDGVDGVLEIVDELVNKRGRDDVRAVLMGFGDCLADLKAQSTALGLDSHVTFTGRVGQEDIARYLSGADIGIGPDQLSPLNDVSTMNKTMEYMAFALPTVSYDLKETRVSAAECGVFVPSGDVRAFADAVEKLLLDDELRVGMGLAARERVVTELDWKPQAEAYVTVFDVLTDRAPTSERLARWPFAAPAAPTRAFGDLSPVDVDDPAAFRAFLRSRGAARGPVRA